MHRPGSPYGGTKTSSSHRTRHRRAWYHSGSRQQAGRCSCLYIPSCCLSQSALRYLSRCNCQSRSRCNSSSTPSTLHQWACANSRQGPNGQRHPRNHNPRTMPCYPLCHKNYWCYILSRGRCYKTSCTTCRTTNCNQ